MGTAVIGKALFSLLPAKKKHLYHWARHSLSLSVRRQHQTQLGNAEICIVSFPKCGRTWLRVMLARALSLQFQLENEVEQAGNLVALADKDARVPRIYTTHDDIPHRKHPWQLKRDKSEYRDKKVILMVRDPRDVMVSLFFQSTRRENFFSGDLAEFLKLKIGGLDSFVRFYHIWEENRGVPKGFHLVRYEDFHKDPEQELQNVLQFIGIVDVDQAIVQDAVSFAAFENMRKLELRGDFRFVPSNAKDSESYKARKGKVGGYREYLDDSQIQRLDEKISSNMPEYYGY